MKKYIYLLLFSLPLLAASCSKDNYDEPQETFRGKFIDKQTGEPFQTAIGNTGIRIRMMEYSWSDNPQPYDMNVKMDGTFNNTKVFKGEYGITPSGAFVPLEEERIKISGTVEKTWEVEPLLRVEWVGEPVVNADGTVDVKVKVSRGTDNPDYQEALAEAWLFVSENMYVGDFSYSPNYSTRISVRPSAWCSSIKSIPSVRDSREVIIPPAPIRRSRPFRGSISCGSARGRRGSSTVPTVTITRLSRRLPQLPVS